MKITMKNTITMAAVAALTLAFGLAYAADDELPFMNTKDTGTEIYEAFLGHDEFAVKGSAAGGVRMDAEPRTDVYTSDELPFMNTKDTGTEIYESYLKREADIAAGAAPGGIGEKGVKRTHEYTNDEMPPFPHSVPRFAK